MRVLIDFKPGDALMLLFGLAIFGIGWFLRRLEARLTEVESGASARNGRTAVHQADTRAAVADADIRGIVSRLDRIEGMLDRLKRSE